MLFVRFLSITKLDAEPNRLEPAPGVTDWEEISEALLRGTPVDDVESLLKGDHEIRGSYRGCQMYLYPNVRFNRHGVAGWNGYALWPNKGDQEEVDLRACGAVYSARVEYV